MPILPISDGQGALKLDAPFICWATMLFPDDEEKREQMAWRTLVAAILAEAAEAGEENVTIDLADQVELVASAHLDRLPEVLAKRTAAGRAAGDILQHLVAFAAHVPEHASVHKATYVVCQQLKESSAQGRRKTPASRSWARTAWSQFKCVSHLWAAFLNFGELAKEAGMPDLHIVEASPEALFYFLTISEWYRHQGESILPQSQVIPTLDPTVTWKVPDDLILPELELSLSASPRTIEVLRRYRAPKHVEPPG